MLDSRLRCCCVLCPALAICHPEVCLWQLACVGRGLLLPPTATICGAQPGGRQQPGVGCLFIGVDVCTAQRNAQGLHLHPRPVPAAVVLRRVSGPGVCRVCGQRTHNCVRTLRRSAGDCQRASESATLRRPTRVGSGTPIRRPAVQRRVHDLPGWPALVVCLRGCQVLVHSVLLGDGHPPLRGSIKGCTCLPRAYEHLPGPHCRTCIMSCAVVSGPGFVHTCPAPC